MDPRLQDIVNRMFGKCYEEADYKPAIGIAIESRRLDVVEEGIRLANMRHQKKLGASDPEKDGGVALMEYVLDIAMEEVQELSLRERV
jgi:26S proteasome regulatory subunit N2